MDSKFYARWVLPFLFLFDPEWIHDRAMDAAERASSSAWLCSRTKQWLAYDDPILAVEVAGMHFRHPIGLAAGFEKSGRGVPLWGALGFSHVEIGSVSAHFSAGNPKVRLFR